MSLMNNMLSPSSIDSKKRLFSTIIEATTTNKSNLNADREVIESKRPRVANNNKLSVTVHPPSTSTKSNELVVVEPSTSIEQENHSRQTRSSFRQPICIDANVQTDLNMINSVISLIPEPFVTPTKIVSALISPPKTPPSSRPNPQLSRAKSTVSISNVTNVSVSRKLISFSSMRSMDVPSATSAMQTESEQQSVKPVEIKTKRPRLKHTRTAAVDGTDEPPELNHNLQPNKKQRVDFGSVDVYSFNFTQSYDTIPTEGGIPIGMEDKHHEVRHYESYRDFQRERFAENTSKHSLDSSIMGAKRRRVKSTQDSLFQDLKSNRRGFPDTSYGPSSSKSTQRTSDKWNTSDDELVEQSKRNRIMLPMDKRRKQAIIKTNEIQLDKEINDECLRIKQSRQMCGCSCQNGVCLPETCQCSLDGIGCLVDKPSFPCSCSESSCKNPFERHEFDADKVRVHYQETLKRIKTEKRHRVEDEGISRSKSLSALRVPDSLTPIPFTIPLNQTEWRVPDKLTPRPFTIPLSQTEWKAPLARSFERLELKTPPKTREAKKMLGKSPSLSKITTQFSASGSISIPFRTPPNITRRQMRPKRYPVTPTFRQVKTNPDNDDSVILVDEPSVIVLNDSTLTQSVMEIDDSIQILSSPRPSTRSIKQAEVCEVVVTSPTKPATDLFAIHQQQSSEDLQTVVERIVPQNSLLSAESRSLSAATTTTDESRTNSTEEFQPTPVLLRVD